MNKTPNNKTNSKAELAKINESDKTNGSENRKKTSTKDGNSVLSEINETREE